MTTTHSRTVTVTPEGEGHFSIQKIVNGAIELAVSSVLDDCRKDIVVTIDPNEEKGIVTVEASITISKEVKQP